MLKRLAQRSEFFIAVTIVGICVWAGVVSDSFFTLENFFSLLRSSIILGIFAVGVLLVLVSGGIDVSFPAIAAFCFYTTTKLLAAVGYEGHIVLAFLIAGALGTLLGLFNAIFIALLRLPTLIVTLGTLSLFHGAVLTFVGTDYIMRLPPGFTDFARTYLFRGQTESGAYYQLPAVFLIFAAAVAVTWFILNRTLLGRGIYAIGGSEVAAQRAGFNIVGIKFFIYGYVGLLAGLAGIAHVSLARMANPFDIVGMELSVITAVVLGGARITGGHGSILGTLLGVALLVLIGNNLILLGIDSTWQKAVFGVLILIGVSMPAIQARLSGRGGRLRATG